MSDVSIFSKIAYIEGVNMIDSWSLSGLRSNILKSISQEAMQRWRYFIFNSSMIYFTVSLLICTF